MIEAHGSSGRRRALPIHWGTFWSAGVRSIGARRFSEPASEFRTHALRVARSVEILTPSHSERLHPPDR